ncbi:MAG TPA: DUF2975 domain-containing protein [Firmicutes bacterium]|nr:DUF2975 domain-containing protein [Bacillota bacterium]
MPSLRQDGKNGLSRAIEYALDFLMGLAVVLTLTLRWSIPAVTHHHPGQEGFWFEKYMAVLVLSGVLAVLILWQARGIMHIINKGNPFVSEMVRRLRTIGVECLVLAAFYFVSVFVVTRFFMVVVFVTFSVVGLILFVFAQIFRQAIAYKEENDMTI